MLHALTKRQRNKIKCLMWEDNGYLPERTMQTGIGDVEVKVPRVRDRSSDGVTFSSALLPPYLKGGLDRRLSGSPDSFAGRSSQVTVGQHRIAAQEAVGDRAYRVAEAGPIRAALHLLVGRRRLQQRSNG